MVANAADILWSAEIDDNTAIFFLQFNKNLDDASTRSSKSFGRVGRHARMSGKAIGIVGGIVGGLTTELIRMGKQGISQFMALAKATVMATARADTLAIALDTVGGNVGYATAEMDELEKSVRANGISISATRQLLLQMAGANLDLAKAVDLTRIAQDAAVIAQTNSSDAAQRIIHAITSLNPLILRHMDLYVDFTEEYKNATRASDRTAESLSTQEKQVIALNAVIRVGARISGTYEAAMETAGKQAGSTARFVEDLLVELGRVFQPALLTLILRFNRLLQDAAKWLHDNREAVDRFASALADGMELGIGLAEDLVGALKDMPGIFIEIEAGLLKMATAISDEEMKKRVENIGVTFKQYLSLLAGWWALSITYLTGIVDTLFDSLRAVWELMSLMIVSAKVLAGISPVGEMVIQFAEVSTALTEIGNDVLTWRDKATKAANDSILAMAIYLGLVDDVGDATEDAAEKAADALRGLAKETEELIEKIKELNDKIGKDLADAAIEAERDIIEAAIRNQRRLEDIARRNVQRIEDIYRRHTRRRADLERDLQDDTLDTARDAADRRAELARDHANELLEIEIEYGRRLEDIRRRFEYDASEAARANDAVAVARMLRKRAFDIQGAGIERDRDIEDEDRDYAEELAKLREHQERMRKERKDDAARRRADLERQLQEELEDAEIARQRDLENMEISLVRERELKALYAQWDLEDLHRKYEEELRLLGTHMADLEYIDEAGLRLLLELHGQYIVDDLTMWGGYYARLQAMAQQMALPIGKTPVNWSQGPATPSKGAGSGQGGAPKKGSSWAYQEGGIGLTSKPQQVTIGEGGPELVAAIPLSAVVNYNHNINMSGDLTVEGVSPAAEANMVPLIMNVLAEFGRTLLAQSGGGR